MKAGIANTSILFIALAGLLILGHSNQAKSEEILLKLPREATSQFLAGPSGMHEDLGGGRQRELSIYEAIFHTAGRIDRAREESVSKRFPPPMSKADKAKFDAEVKTYSEFVSRVKQKYYDIFKGTLINPDTVVMNSGKTAKAVFAALESVPVVVHRNQYGHLDSTFVALSALNDISMSSAFGVDISKSRTQRTPFRVVNGRSNASLVKAEMTLSRAIESARRNRGNGPIFLSIAAGVIVSGAANAGEAEPVELAGDSKPTFDRSWARPKSQRVSN